MGIKYNHVVIIEINHCQHMIVIFTYHINERVNLGRVAVKNIENTGIAKISLITHTHTQNPGLLTVNKKRADEHILGKDSQIKGEWSPFW